MLESLLSAIAGLSREMSRSPEAHANVSPAFILLTEALVESLKDHPAPPMPPIRQRRMERLVELEQQMKDVDPGARVSAITERMGIGPTYFYRLRTFAVERGLLPPTGCTTTPQ